MSRHIRGCAIQLSAVLAVGLLLGASAHATMITFDWSAPNPRTAPEGTTSLSVDLLADQSGGADTAAITLGFTTGGIVTDVALDAFGSSVSALDSFFGPTGGEILLIAVAPSSPGSFGIDTDFTIATLTVTIDTGLGSAGTLSLKDLTTFAGAPALESDGLTEVPSDLSTSFNVVVPEAATGVLLSFGLLLLVGARGPRQSG